MKTKRKLFTLAALLVATLLQAQEWTVIELPTRSGQMNALIKERFGCDYYELPSKYTLTHVKFTGTDLVCNNQSSIDLYAIKALVEKAKVIDLSEVKDNPNSIAYYEQQGIEEYPGPNTVVNYICYGNQATEHFIYPKTLRRIISGLGNFTELKQVTWPDVVVELANNQFFACSSLEQIAIPNSVSILPENCFNSCSSLTVVTLPAGLKTLDNEAFAFCESLPSLTLPSGLEFVGNGCFRNCKALTALTLPETVTFVGPSAFEGCESLTHMTLPAMLTSVPDYQFYMCYKLRSVDIPAGVKSIGSSAFGHCQLLTQLQLPEVLDTIKYMAFANSGLQQLEMPDALTSLGDFVFDGCKQLTRVHLGRALTTIPEGTFRECELLADVNIPRRVTAIGNEAFKNCLSLPSPQLPEGLLTIGDAAFSGTSFEEVTLPSTLQLIGADGFRYSKLRSIDVPSSVIQIDRWAFNCCDSLRQATLHEGLLYLRDQAFSDCRLLADVALPNSLRVLDGSVFSGNKSKKSYVQPPLINEVPSDICYACDSLKSVVLHANVKKIGSSAFNNCLQLTSVTLPEGLQEIGSYAFYACPLKTVTIPSSVRTIDYCAFAEGNYSRLVVPEGVEEVMWGAFSSENLRYVDFPSTISLLGEYPFQGNKAYCDSIVIRAILPPKNNGSLYNNTNIGSLYVPTASVTAYQHDEGFNSSFASIKPLIDYAPTDVVISTAASTDSIWFPPIVSGANLTVTSSLQWVEYNYNNSGGHLHVGSKVNWPLNHLRYDYRLGWQNFDDYLTATLINEGTMTARSMEMNLSILPNEWFYFTPLFDIKASDMVSNSNRFPFVLRRFDGSRRAAGDHGHVWQDVSADDILHAGEGYILQYGHEQNQIGYEEWRTNGEGFAFHMATDAPQNVLALSSQPVTLPLTDYQGEFPHNMGWNLVGNPFMAYYDIRHIEGDAPIVVSTEAPYLTFQTFSPLDDEYILRPLMGFFVQRSEKQTDITFNPSGRQADKVIRHDSENNARSLRRASLRRERTVYNAVLTRSTLQGDSIAGRTRVVVTPRATEGYDRGQDAPFMTMDDTRTALYSRSAGLRYSLNEQPPTTASVQMGMHLAQPGSYTLAFTVKGTPTADHLWLTDKETGEKTDMLTDSYTFTIDEPCTLNNRFTLQLSDGITEVKEVREVKEGLRAGPSVSWGCHGSFVPMPSIIRSDALHGLFRCLAYLYGKAFHGA